MNSEIQEKSEQQKLLENAEISIEKAKELILEHIPNEEIQAIYIKGSYVQGELQEDSDIDIVVILKSDKCLQDIYELTNRFSKTTPIPFQAVAYTLNELRTGELIPNRTNKPTSVSIFVKQLDQLPLIYGSKPEGKLFTRTDVRDLTALLSAFKKDFLPNYNNGSFSFKSLVKQVLWLVEREVRAHGIVPEYSWQKLADSIKDPDHIIHLALTYRRGGKVPKEEKDKFVQRLNEYLEFLEGKYRKSENK